MPKASKRKSLQEALRPISKNPIDNVPTTQEVINELDSTLLAIDEVRKDIVEVRNRLGAISSRLFLRGIIGSPRTPEDDIPF